MPEGHTIHRIARDQRRDFIGQQLIVSSPQGRFSEGAKYLNGKELRAIEAHGKHLFYQWSGRKRLHVHLGLYGKFRRHKTPPPEPRGQVRLRVIGEEKAFDLNGPNACELISNSKYEEIRNRLGEDPLRADADVDKAWRRIKRSRAALGTLLLNQSVIAGVGNVYRSEVLHLLGIHPETPGKELSQDRFEELWAKIKELLEIGVRYNRIIVADPEDIGKPRSRMNRQERLLIYKRPNCSRCGSKVTAWILGARKVFACTNCQQKAG